MTEHATPADYERTADSADPPNRSEFLATPSRRRLLQTLTSGGALLLAGCGQDDPTDASTPTGTTTQRETASSRVLDQTFRAPVDQNPTRASFYAPWAGDALEPAFAVTPKKQVSGRLQSIIREPGVWTDERWVGGGVHYTWIDDITITPTEITVTIGDDATWSDGTPITGRDLAVGVMDSYIRNYFPPYYATEEEDEPTLSVKAIDDFDIGDKSVTYRSSPGYFDLFWESTLTYYGRGRNAVPTHIEPYGTYTDAVFETARKAIQGEINPWKGWDDPFTQPDDPRTATLVEEHLAKRGKYVSKFSKPEHVVSTSAWDLIELNGPEAVFEPNPHHRHADALNFERLVLEYTASEERVGAALKADRLDYAAPGPTPQTVVESLPDHFTQLQIPGGRNSGNELHLDFAHPALGNRKVRMALMHALDHSTIANNIHQSAALPMTTPGGDCWDATDYVSEEWIDENLTTYTHDRKRAASLMRETGYTRDGGGWINADGEPLTLSLPTKSSTPRWEPTVASQLTEFGIQTSVKTIEEATFERREENGEFSMWAESGRLTSTADRTLAHWYGVAVHPKVYGVYPKQQFETGGFSKRGHPVPRTQERYGVFTIEAPPIGQPNGPFREYHPSALAVAFFNNPPEAEFQRRVKTAMWLANWLLPTIPINKTLVQHFIDDAHWQWPTDTPAWQTFSSNGPKSVGGIFASGTLRADLDNPEQA